MERQGSYPSDRGSTPVGYGREEYPYRGSSTSEQKNSSRFSDISRDISIERRKFLLYFITSKGIKHIVVWSEVNYICQNVGTRYHFQVTYFHVVTYP